MNTNEEIKEMVKPNMQKLLYKTKKLMRHLFAAGSGGCSTEVYNIMTGWLWPFEEGYNPNADLKLGCICQTESGKIKKRLCRFRKWWKRLNVARAETGNW